MSKTPLAQLPAKLYELLEPHPPEDRARIVQATMLLLGDEPISAGVPGQPTPTNAVAPATPANPIGTPSDAAAFIDEKAPKNKQELLAVAARYRELTANEETHSKEDFKVVFTEARRNFDDHNFARDMDNTKRQSGFFIKGTGRGENKLSYYGQQFVDALPDREAAEKLNKPVVRGKKKAAKKKTSKKKAN